MRTAWHQTNPMTGKEEINPKSFKLNNMHMTLSWNLTVAWGLASLNVWKEVLNRAPNSARTLMEVCHQANAEEKELKAWIEKQSLMPTKGNLSIRCKNQADWISIDAKRRKMDWANSQKLKSTPSTARLHLIQKAQVISQQDKNWLPNRSKMTKDKNP